VAVSLQSQKPFGEAMGVAVAGVLLAAAAVPGASVAHTVSEEGPPFAVTVALTLPPAAAAAAGALRALQGGGGEDADAEAAALADRLLNDGSFAYALAAAGVPGDLGYDSIEALMSVRLLPVEGAWRRPTRTFLCLPRARRSPYMCALHSHPAPLHRSPCPFR
jgi:hypothetical protein